MTVTLREVLPDDIAVFFEHQLDPLANHMAAFVTEDPTDWPAFENRWRRIMADDDIRVQTILYDGHVAGHILRYVDDGKPEVSYWIDRPLWGKGIATHALASFLELEWRRPLYARAASDNHGSIRVLQKNGFRIVDSGTGFANARRQEVLEVMLRLDLIHSRDDAQRAGRG